MIRNKPAIRARSVYRRSCGIAVAIVLGAWCGCASVRLITVDPGHFHAALVQKTMYGNVDPAVYVYAPGGRLQGDLDEHLKRIEGFNSRVADPTHWHEVVYTGVDFFDRMLAEKRGNVVVLSGNNARKTAYISKSVEAGLNVLADKPMAIVPGDFEKLREAFEVAGQKHVVLYDIMTERYEITTILQRELSQQPELFGTLAKGTEDVPGIEMASVHFFSKTVAGAPLKRPAWFYDVRQEGEGMTDVGTHLVDLVQWEAFPQQLLRPADVQVMKARHWTTPITREQFAKTTGEKDFPDYLKPDVKDGVLQVYANGEMTYQLRGVRCRVKATWEFEAAAGGDTHASTVRGTKARLMIRQTAAENYKPVLYVEAAESVEPQAFEARMKKAVDSLQSAYPGIGYRREGDRWRVTIPESYDVGHEAHFAQVTQNFLKYVHDGTLPAWETAYMMTKYDTIRRAYEMCLQAK